MSNDLYLVAHKVRGEPAFDIAERMECPECNGHGDRDVVDGHTIPCTECDSLGYWWIIGTSGHRAYPWWDKQFSRISCEGWLAVLNDPWRDIPEMPSSLPDHYHHTASPATVRARLEDLLSALPPTPTTPFKRRF